jgi:hypothetical protein
MKHTFARTSLVIFVLLIVIVAGAYLYMPNVEAYKTSLAFVQGNEQISQYLGKNISGHLSFVGWKLRSNRASFKIYVSGDYGKAIVTTDLNKFTGVWKIAKANLLLEDGSVIHLINNKP